MAPRFYSLCLIITIKNSDPFSNGRLATRFVKTKMKINSQLNHIFLDFFSCFVGYDRLFLIWQIADRFGWFSHLTNSNFLEKWINSAGRIEISTAYFRVGLCVYFKFGFVEFCKVYLSVWLENWDLVVIYCRLGLLKKYRYSPKSKYISALLVHHFTQFPSLDRIVNFLSFFPKTPNGFDLERHL